MAYSLQKNNWKLQTSYSWTVHSQHDLYSIHISGEIIEIGEGGLNRYHQPKPGSKRSTLPGWRQEVPEQLRQHSLQ